MCNGVWVHLAATLRLESVSKSLMAISKISKSQNGVSEEQLTTRDKRWGWKTFRRKLRVYIWRTFLMGLQNTHKWMIYCLHFATQMTLVWEDNKTMGGPSQHRRPLRFWLPWQNPTAILLFSVCLDVQSAFSFLPRIPSTQRHRPPNYQLPEAEKKSWELLRKSRPEFKSTVGSNRHNLCRARLWLARVRYNPPVPQINLSWPPGARW